MAANAAGGFEGELAERFLLGGCLDGNFGEAMAHEPQGRGAKAALNNKLPNYIYTFG